MGKRRSTMDRIVSFNGDDIDLEKLTLIGKVTSKHIDRYVGSISQFEYYVGNTQLFYQGHDSKDKREALIRMWADYHQNKAKSNTALPNSDEELALVQLKVEELILALDQAQKRKIRKILDLVGEDNEKIEVAVETLNTYL